MGKTVKTIQLLNGDNVNISPATDVNSIYYEYDDNGIIKRKYVYDQWPVKLSLSNYEMTCLTNTTTENPLVIDSNKKIKNQINEDVLVSYIYQSVLPGTNIYQLNSSVYNLSNILFGYTGKAHLDSSIKELETQVEEDFKKSYIELEAKVNDISSNIEKTINVSVNDISTAIDKTISDVNSLKTQYETNNKTITNINAYVEQVKADISKIGENYAFNIIDVNDFNKFYDFIFNNELIPNCIYKIGEASFISRPNSQLTSNFQGSIYIKATSTNTYDPNVWRIDSNLSTTILEMQIANDNESFYITYLKDSNNNIANFDFIDYIKGSNNYIILFNNAFSVMKLDISGNNNNIKLYNQLEEFTLHGSNNIIDGLDVSNVNFDSNNSIIKNVSIDSSNTYSISHCTLTNCTLAFNNPDINLQYVNISNSSYVSFETSCAQIYINNSLSNIIINIIKQVSNVYVQNYAKDLDIENSDAYYTSATIYSK